MAGRDLEYRCTGCGFRVCALKPEPQTILTFGIRYQVTARQCPMEEQRENVRRDRLVETFTHARCGVAEGLFQMRKPGLYGQLVFAAWNRNKRVSGSSLGRSGTASPERERKEREK